MYEQVLFLNKKPDRPLNLDEYRQNSGYSALDLVLRSETPSEVTQKIKDSGLRGRGGAGSEVHTGQYR